MTWKTYARKGAIECRPYVAGETLDGISISESDRAEFIANGGHCDGMIARSPGNPRDQWFINLRYFEAHYTEQAVDRIREELLPWVYGADGMVCMFAGIPLAEMNPTELRECLAFCVHYQIVPRGGGGAVTTKKPGWQDDAAGD